MIVRALDSNGDWTFGRGLNNYLSGNAAIAQNIQTQLFMFLGDCFFAADKGIDWWNLLGRKNQLAINLAINACIVQVDGVTGLLQSSMNLSRATRALSITYSVTTIYSTLTATYQYNFPV